MVRFVQFVIGPAGTGKSTYCHTMQQHCMTNKRTVHVANLDPAAEHFEYDPVFDIQDLISLQDVMEELDYGPNGGLVYCMEYLLQNSDWLHEELDKSGEDDYVIIDCPGQIELYSHLPIMRNLVKEIEGWGFRCVCVYLIDALFVLDPSKFVSGCMLSLSCMMQLELPQVNVVTKCDVVDKAAVQAVLELESTYNYLNDKNVPHNMQRLTSAISSVVDDYMMVGFVMLDPTEEESMDLVMFHTDHAIQYGEDLEPKEFQDGGGEEEDGNS